jgi:hypothetical protein
MSDSPSATPADGTRSRLTDLLETRFPTLVVVAATLGCVMLLIEMLIGHHAQGERRIGMIFAVLGIAVSVTSTVLILAGVRLSAIVRGAVLAAWAVLAVGGLIGVWKHLDGEGEGGRGEASLSTIVSDAAPAAEEEGGGDGGNRPPLAPLSFTGLGMLGGLGFLLETGPRSSRRRRDDTTA